MTPQFCPACEDGNHYHDDFRCLATYVVLIRTAGGGINKEVRCQCAALRDVDQRIRSRYADTQIEVG